jgi:hypothetical protein
MTRAIETAKLAARITVDTAGNAFVGTPTTAGQNTGGLTIDGIDIELMQIMGAL